MRNVSRRERIWLGLILGVVLLFFVNAALGIGILIGVLGYKKNKPALVGGISLVVGVGLLFLDPFLSVIILLGAFMCFLLVIKDIDNPFIRISSKLVSFFLFFVALTNRFSGFNLVLSPILDPVGGSWNDDVMGVDRFFMFRHEITGSLSQSVRDVSGSTPALNLWSVYTLGIILLLILIAGILYFAERGNAKWLRTIESWIGRKIVGKTSVEAYLSKTLPYYTLVLLRIYLTSSFTNLLYVWVIGGVVLPSFIIGWNYNWRESVIRNRLGTGIFTIFLYIATYLPLYGISVPWMFVLVVLAIRLIISGLLVSGRRLLSK